VEKGRRIRILEIKGLGPSVLALSKENISCRWMSLSASCSTLSCSRREGKGDEEGGKDNRILEINGLGPSVLALSKESLQNSSYRWAALVEIAFSNALIQLFFSLSRAATRRRFIFLSFWYVQRLNVVFGTIITFRKHKIEKGRSKRRKGEKEEKRTKKRRKGRKRGERKDDVGGEIKKLNSKF
jgi:hypothetical protein